VKTLRPASQVPQVAIEPLEVLPLLMATKNLKNLISSARVGLRTLGRRLAGERPLWMGQALVARLMQIALKRGVDVRLGTALVDLLTENGRVVGARVRHNGVDSDLRADAGIVLCAGGFARNSALRKKYQGVDDCLSAAVPEDTGDALHAALKLGAATTLLDEAWWGVSAVFPDDTRYFLLWERTFPHSLIVDAGGNRFADEAAPYNDFGRAVLDRQREFAGAPCWLIMDARHRRNYVFGNLLGGYTPDSLISKGVFKKASSLEDLARQCHLDPAALQRTVERFNVFAKTGKDEDFGRGDTIFDRVYGDADTKPNPTLGAVEQAPFWAVRVHPSDLGTKGGLLTDADGRVVDTAGQPIPGLYASGNATASVMGRGYPGPGATLGPATVFAYRAVRHAVLAGAPAGERAASA
jgi:3-oxosteroid 1-dehydrogenase